MGYVQIFEQVDRFQITMDIMYYDIRNIEPESFRSASDFPNTSSEDINNQKKMFCILFDHETFCIFDFSLIIICMKGDRYCGN